VTVRDKVGRTRYVAFRLEGGPVGRAALAAALPEWARLTRFDGTHGVVRCLHTQRDALVEALCALERVGGRDVRVRTLATSGTMRGVARAFPPGVEVRERKRESGKRRPPAKEPKTK
jgi:RNase P/RNase MRP subunit POP5